MDNREWIAELAKIKQIAQRKIELGVSFGMTPEQVTNEVFDLLEAFGYTCQPEPSIGPYEIPHAAYDKHFTPPEPLPDRVEAVAKMIELVMYPGYYPEEVRKEAAERVARSILSLFPEPVLTRISDHEIEILLQTSEHDYYNVTEGDKAIAQAQLAHTKKELGIT